jgi:hypothetical protein
MAGEFDRSHREIVFGFLYLPHDMRSGPDSRQAVLMQLQPSWSVI